MLAVLEPSRPERIAVLEASGYPCYTTSPGWLGYDDEKLRRLCQEAVDAGFSYIKLKVGANLADDRRRCGIAREVLGPDRHLMIDANQVWEVPQAIEWVNALADFAPLWIEEPTSPDDILGHAAVRAGVAPIGVATGEHGHNRVMFKQLLQAGAIDFCQIDSCRLASVNEILTVLLLAAKFGVPVCPHAGGVGLCELVQHLSIFDYVAVSGSMDGRVAEYVDHLHEHFVDPCVVAGRRLPTPDRARLQRANAPTPPSPTTATPTAPTGPAAPTCSPPPTPPRPRSATPTPPSPPRADHPPWPAPQTSSPQSKP